MVASNRRPHLGIGLMLRQGDLRFVTAVESPLDQSLQACVGILHVLGGVSFRPAEAPPSRAEVISVTGSKFSPPG